MQKGLACARVLSKGIAVWRNRTVIAVKQPAQHFQQHIFLFGKTVDHPLLLAAQLVELLFFGHREVKPARCHLLCHRQIALCLHELAQRLLLCGAEKRILQLILQKFLPQGVVTQLLKHGAFLLFLKKGSPERSCLRVGEALKARRATKLHQRKAACTATDMRRFTPRRHLLQISHVFTIHPTALCRQERR